MIAIADRVWRTWQRLEDQEEEPAIVLRLSTRSEAGAVAAAVKDAYEHAATTLEERAGPPAPGEFEFRAGACHVASTPAGVLLRIDEEPDDFEGLLRLIAAGLEQRGVDGAIDLYEPPAMVQLPDAVALLECRLRVAGGRAVPRGRWRPDPDALARLVSDATPWCVDDWRHGGARLRVGLLPDVTVTPAHDVHALMRNAIRDCDEYSSFQLTSGDAQQFRTVVVEPFSARVTLIDGGATIERTGWQAPLDGLVQMLCQTAEQTVYGFIKRGSQRSAAEHDHSLDTDWPARRDTSTIGTLAHHLEDTHAPDAFGVQLLGPSYAGRIPSGPAWRQTHLPAGRILLEHVDAPAWFDHLFVPFGGFRGRLFAERVDAPSILAHARTECAELLLTDDVVHPR